MQRSWHIRRHVCVQGSRDEDVPLGEHQVSFICVSVGVSVSSLYVIYIQAFPQNIFELLMFSVNS